MDLNERAVAAVPEGPPGTRGGGDGGAETPPPPASWPQGARLCKPVANTEASLPALGRRWTALSLKLTRPGTPRRLPGDTGNQAQLSPGADDLLMNRVLGRPGGRPHGVQRGGLLATTTGQPAPPGPHCPHWAQGDLVAAGLGGRLPPRLACLLQVPGPPLTSPTPISCPVSPS